MEIERPVEENRTEPGTVEGTAELFREHVVEW
jgi:hypothetical protein